LALPFFSPEEQTGDVDIWLSSLAYILLLHILTHDAELPQARFRIRYIRHPWDTFKADSITPQRFVILELMESEDIVRAKFGPKKSHHRGSGYRF
jgi:hypothetical protein